MKRVALYARYSSDLQSAKSCEDQLALLREEAAKRGWQVVREYRDEAISGASIVRRPGILELLKDSETNAFDIVVAEALDRLSRDEADTPMLRKRLAYYGVTIWTFSEGDVQSIHVALKGAMNSMFLVELANKIRRGHRGVIASGRSAGGRCYGYRPVKGEKGVLEIVEDEAAIVRRIFAAYARDRSPYAIASDLNAEGVPGPNGAPWNRHAIMGNARVLQGVLFNPLYHGERVWNRQRNIRHPVTGQRQMKTNPESEWRRSPAPQLRIIDEPLWEAVQHRARSLAGKGGAAKRAKQLFSGLLTCASCGGRMQVCATATYGCGNHRQRGTCDNRRTVAEKEIVARTVEGLKSALLSPAARRNAARAFETELARLRAADDGRGPELTREIDAIGRKIARLIDLVADAGDTPEAGAKISKLRSERARLESELKSVGRRHVITLIPNLGDLYDDAIDRLSETIADPEAGDIRTTLRGFITNITLTPRSPRLRGYDMQVHGDLGAFLQSPAHEPAFTFGGCVDSRESSCQLPKPCILWPTERRWRAARRQRVAPAESEGSRPFPLHRRIPGAPSIASAFCADGLTSAMPRRAISALPASTASFEMSMPSTRMRHTRQRNRIAPMRAAILQHHRALRQFSAALRVAIEAGLQRDIVFHLRRTIIFTAGKASIMKRSLAADPINRTVHQPSTRKSTPRQAPAGPLWNVGLGKKALFAFGGSPKRNSNPFNNFVQKSAGNISAKSAASTVALQSRP
jgi:site-specific DNA recombinase